MAQSKRNTRKKTAKNTDVIAWLEDFFNVNQKKGKKRSSAKSARSSSRSSAKSTSKKKSHKAGRSNLSAARRNNSHKKLSARKG